MVKFGCHNKVKHFLKELSYFYTPSIDKFNEFSVDKNKTNNQNICEKVKFDQCL